MGETPSELPSLAEILVFAEKRAKQYERARETGLAIYGDNVAGDIRNIISMIRYRLDAVQKKLGEESQDAGANVSGSRDKAV